MANYAYRAHSGISATNTRSFMAELESLVNYTAAGVSWNQLGAPPSGFEGDTVKTHKKSGVTFSPGFQMFRSSRGDQKWEGHTPANSLAPGPKWLYRIDLQAISDDGANFSMQTNGSDSDTVAVCLMELNKSFSRRHLIHALKTSMENGQICILTQ